MLSRPDAESLNFWRACCSSCRGKRRLYCSELLEEKPQQEDFWIDFRRWKSGGKRRNSEQWWKWISHTPCLSDHRISNLKVANWASLKPSLFLLRGSPHCLGGGRGDYEDTNLCHRCFLLCLKIKWVHAQLCLKFSNFLEVGWWKVRHWAFLQTHWAIWNSSVKQGTWRWCFCVPFFWIVAEATSARTVVKIFKVCSWSLLQLFNLKLELRQETLRAWKVRFHPQLCTL